MPETPLHSESLQGRICTSDDPHALRRAIDLAFDYRGDVTITRQSTGQAIEGYMFDRSFDRARNELAVRIIPKDSDDRIVIPLSDIASLAFTGKDTASGKTFENWVKRYVQKKRAGEAASIESEALD